MRDAIEALLAVTGAEFRLIAPKEVNRIANSVETQADVMQALAAMQSKGIVDLDPIGELVIRRDADLQKRTGHQRMESIRRKIDGFQRRAA